MDELVHRHQLHGGDAQREQVVDDRVVGQREVRAPDPLGEVRVAHRHPPDVALVDDRSVPGRARLAVVAPREGRIDHHALRHTAGAVPFVEREVLVRVADRVAVQRVVPLDGPADGLRVRVEQELVRIEAMPAPRIVWSVDPVAVQLPRPGVGQVAMPDQVGPVAELDAVRGLRVVRVVEQAQLDGFGVLAEQREVDPLPVPIGPLGVRRARPDPEQVSHGSSSEAG